MKYEDQQKLIVGYNKKSFAPFEVPHLLDAATSICMEYVRYGIYLYGIDSYMTIRCQEEGGDGYRLIVGAFGLEGLYIRSMKDDVSSSLLGVSASCRLSVE